MKVRRLGWAGLEVEVAGETLLIDLFEDNSPLEPFIGAARDALPAPAGETAAGALVTHLHSDHCDPPALQRALGDGAPVLRPAPSDGEGLEVLGCAAAESAFTESGLRQVQISAWETRELGPFTVTAVPAVDGLGDPQVSWVVEGGGARILHGGDTLFHGYWWPIVMRCGEIDAAFLPVNGAVVNFPHRQPPHELGCAMDPVEAANAAATLAATLAVPIHYDTLHGPPTYAQVDRPADRFLEKCERLGVEAELLEVGSVLELPR